MPLIEVRTLDDPRIAVYRALKATNETRGQPLFVAEGEKLLDWLLSSRYPLVSVVVVERLAGRVAAKVPPDVPVYVMPGPLIGQVVGYNFHQGVLACGRRVGGPSLEETVVGKGSTTLVVLPEIHNPENLGSIVRTADVFGVDALLTGPNCPDPLSRRVLRVSMGTALRLPILVEDALEGTIDRARRALGTQFVCCVTDPEAEPLESFASNRPAHLGLLLGSEAHGLEARWLQTCDRRVTIPMRDGAESLNVGIAAGILLYRLTQR